MNKMYYEQRFIKNSKGNTEFLLFEEENRLTLSDIILENKRVVLLGNPGIGKSTELEVLFENLWETRENSLNFPFNINLKNFRKTSKFEDLIPFNEWIELPIITFILDGLDEIAEIQDFVSEMENFLKRNEDKNINVVISCRTNIYEKYLIKISGFKYFYLEGLSDKQINNILEKRISKQLSFTELDKFRVYLTNPFNLNLFCEFYEEKKTYPEKQSESWNLFIENELKKLSKEKLIKREEIDIPHLKKCIEKVAFANELMQQNYITDDNLYELLGQKDKSIFEQISFIERLPNSDSYNFRHKNYQEFFSAKFLSDLSSSEIISILKLNPDVNKTKPSLFNTITFLLNIIDDNKFNEVKNWLSENESEILFLTEKERLNIKTQNEIFEKYFNEIAVEKTLWFGKDRRFSLDKVAEFADIDFLISIIKEDKHFRSVISALDVIACTDNSDQDIQIKELLVSIIFSGGKYVETALRTFKAKGFHKKDIPLYRKIADNFQDNYSADIHHQIISMLNDFINIDEYFEILKNSLYKLYEIRPERKKDNTIRGTEWILEKVFLKIQNSENFLHVLDIVFNNRFDIKLSGFYDKKFKEDLINKSLSFVESEDDFLFRVIDAFLRPIDNFIHRNDNFLMTLINKSSKSVNAFKYIINNYGLTNKNYFIIGLFDNKDCIDYLVEKYQKQELHIDNNNDINSLRNMYFRNQPTLGYYFESVFKKVGYTFPEILPTQEEMETNQKKYNDFVQNNFEILFDKEKLTQEISKVFSENDLDNITWEKIHNIEWEWYKKENYHSIQNSVFKVISNSVRNESSKSKEDIITNIKDDYFILFQIKDKIKDRESEGFVIKPEHIKFIKEYCSRFAEEFKFDNVISVTNDNNFRIYNDFYILKMLYFFDKKYDITYSQEFYLKSLKYCNVFGNVEDNIEFIKGKVKDTKKFDEKVINNLNTEMLDSNSLKDHIDYAIENELNGSYQKISDFILNQKYLYSQKDFLIRYVDLLPKHEQINFLKQCCSNIDSYLCWESINIFIIKNLDNEFILKTAKEYLKAEKSEFISNALNVLFYCNDDSALQTYANSLEKLKQTQNIDLRDDFTLKNIHQFNNANNLTVLENIFKIIYDENLKGDFNFYNAKQHFQSIIINLSRTQKGYDEIQNLLKKISLDVLENDYKFFYINNLIDISQISYYNSFSKVLTFNEAKGYIKTIQN